MKKLFAIAATIAALIAGSSTLEVASAATAKAAPHYDCTKKGNANKAACKTAAETATPSAATPTTSTAPAKRPGLMSKLLHPAPKAPTPAAPATTTSTPTAMADATTPKKAPICKKGKLCGNTCIKATDTCHK